MVGDRPTTTKREGEKWEERKNEGSPSARIGKLAVVAPPHGQDGGVRKDAFRTGDSYCGYRGTRRERSDRQKLWRLRQHNFKTQGGEGRIERY